MEGQKWPYTKMRLKTKIWSKGVHLSKSRFGEKERRKGGEEARA